MKATQQSMLDDIVSHGGILGHAAQGSIGFTLKGHKIMAISGPLLFARPNAGFSTRWKLVIYFEDYSLRFRTWDTLDCYLEGLYTADELVRFKHYTAEYWAKQGY